MTCEGLRRPGHFGFFRILFLFCLLLFVRRGGFRVHRTLRSVGAYLCLPLSCLRFGRCLCKIRRFRHCRIRLFYSGAGLPCSGIGLLRCGSCRFLRSRTRLRSLRILCGHCLLVLRDRYNICLRICRRSLNLLCSRAARQGALRLLRLLCKVYICRICRCAQRRHHAGGRNHAKHQHET